MSENQWIHGLRGSGILISPPVLREELPDGPPEVDKGVREMVRQDWNRLEAGALEIEPWLRTLFHGPLDIENKPLLVLDEEQALEHVPIPAGLRDTTKPSGILLASVDAGTQARLPIWTVDTSDRPRAAWNKACTDARRLLRDLRERGIEIGLVTDGQRFRLLFSGVENEAYLEWDASRWFAEEPHLDEFHGFAWMLNYDQLTPHKEDARLVELAKKSRRKQADLANQLGKRIRKSVEHLLSASFNTAVERAKLTDDPHPLEAIREGPNGNTISKDEGLQAVYQAGIRIVMRTVVASYAEARDLFPTDDPHFADNYSLADLHETLRETERRYGEDYLSRRQWAWPRLLSLFRLIHDGSDHPKMRFHAYGGELFEQGEGTSEDQVLRALSLFEDPRALSDLDVLKILDGVRRAEFTANIRGRRKSAEGPVDFSDLRTEYIGIMYEGLLDYTPTFVEPEQGAYVVLNGKGFHAYPLDRLERLLEEGEIADFLDAVKRKDIKDRATDLEDEAATPEEEENLEDQLGFDEWSEEDHDLQARVHHWARRAVARTNLTDRGATSDEIEDAVNDLVEEVHTPGTIFLMSWEGLRKGSGTYYTRPSLVIPLVRRTLDPLLYKDEEGSIPKTPEEILDVKICDPAMGSGSFLVAAAERITDALYESWQYHGYVDRLRGGDRILLPEGEPATGVEEQRIVSKSPDEEGFEDWLTTRLKRYVVENCIYGVDLNPLAVELAKLSLWLETMDPQLPFEFLDHKLRRGNSLVGAWLSEAFDYPMAAWDRYSDLKTKSASGNNPLHLATLEDREWLKQVRKEAKSQIRDWIPRLKDAPLNGVRVTVMHEEVNELYERIHDLPEKRREEAFREFLESETYRSLKHALDRWCAVWFWPTPEDSDAGVEEPLPTWFYTSWPPEEDQHPREAIEENPVARAANQTSEAKHFFHWEIEFPDVFLREEEGFDAVIGNPPWDKIKPESEIFFTQHDPLYRTYGKQEALANVRRLFEHAPQVEGEWREYKIDQRSQSHFYTEVAQAHAVALGEQDPKPKTTKWYNRVQERGGQNGAWYTGDDELEYEPYRPFTLWRGGRELNLYKLFAEQALRFVHEDAGRIGVVLPDGIFTDIGATHLRKTYLDYCDWEWLYGFENREGIFPTDSLDSRYQFACNIIKRGGQTEYIQSAFLVHDPGNWDTPGGEVVELGRDQIERYSPETFAPAMAADQDDVRVLDSLYAGGEVIRDAAQDDRMEYTREFDHSNDSNLRENRGKIERDGALQDPFGRWLTRDGAIYLPFYEGKMVYLYDFSYAHHQSGRTWNERPWHEKRLYPRYFVDAETYATHDKPTRVGRVSYRDVTNITNERTMVSSFTPALPSNHKLPAVLVSPPTLRNTLGTVATFDSLTFDFVTRRRKNLIKAVLYELPTLPRGMLGGAEILEAGRLSLSNPTFAPEWLVLTEELGFETTSWSESWLWDERERLAARARVDAIVAHRYGLSIEDFDHVCSVDDSNPRSFFRMDKDVAARHRYPRIAHEAFEALQETFAGDSEEFLKKWTPDQAHLEARERIRGEDWVGQAPKDLVADGKGGRIPAIHVHRNHLRDFIEQSGEGRIPEEPRGPYVRLWSSVWDTTRDKTELTMEDCRAYARCYLSLVKPDGAWKRFQEVLDGDQPYGYIYNPELKNSPVEEEDEVDWGDLSRQERKQRDLSEFGGD